MALWGVLTHNQYSKIPIVYKSKLTVSSLVCPKKKINDINCRDKRVSLDLSSYHDDYQTHDEENQDSPRLDCGTESDLQH